MSINITNLYTRLGKIAGAYRSLMGMVGTNATSPSSKWGLTPGGVSGANVLCMGEMLTNIQTNVGGSNPELMAGGSYSVSAPLYQLQTSLPSAMTSALSYLQSLARGLVMDVVNADQFLPNLTADTAMRELIRQMISQSATVHANILGSSLTAGGGNTGNPDIVLSFIDAQGANLQYAYKEVMVLTTTRDVSDGATAGNETISVKAPAGSVAPQLNYLWPSGNGYCSGFQGTLTVVDPTQSNGAGGNLLSNSSFKGTWTTNQPDRWTTDVGAAGTNWQDGTSNNYLGSSHCFEFLGDGATLSSIYQPFANNSVTGGNSSILTPETVYLFRAMYKMSATAAAGVLAFSLTDGSGTIINDNNGVPNTISINLATVGDTSYHALTGAFRTPTVIPSAVRLRIKLTTALSNTKNVFLDGIGMTQPAQQTYGGIYLGGPYLAAFRGSTDTVDFNPNPTTGDRWTLSILNDYGGIWQMFLWQTFNLPQIGLPVPNTAVPTQADTLIS